MKALIIITLFTFSTTTFATCMVKYERTACKGQEKISYKKCNGEKTCEKKKRADSMEDCQKQALKSCRNSRLDITKSKIITASWEGKAIKSKSGKSDFCLDYENAKTEFNQCE